MNEPVEQQPKRRRRERNTRQARIEATFAEYCAMGSGPGERSLVKLARMHAKPGDETNFRTLRRRYELWSARFGWADKLLEYDRNHAEEKRARREAALEKMEEEHALIARQGVLMAAKRIKDLMESGNFGPYSAVQLLKVASDLERLARGGATQRSENETTVNVGGAVGFYTPVELPAKGDLQQIASRGKTVEGTVTVVEEPTAMDERQ